MPKLLHLDTPFAPRAILLVTAHWSTRTPTISSAASHTLYYDYYGFPPEAYELKYPAPGAPDVAEEARRALEEAGLSPVMDATRGWDHGVFVPMALVRPAADIPIVQLSVLQSEDAGAHLRLGAALGRLRASNVAIVGSGFASLHNLQQMMPLLSGGPKRRKEFSALCEPWAEALTGAATAQTGEERRERMARWRAFPNADLMHPPGAGEHFMPLLVCAGAAGEEERGGMYKDVFAGVDIFTYYWGSDALG